MAVYLSSASPINSADRNFAKLCASVILNATTMSRQRWVSTVTLAFSPQLASVSVSTYCSDNVTKLARKMIWSCGKSLASAKGQWTSMFRTCWSPQADPDPNFEPQPYIYIYTYICIYVYIYTLKFSPLLRPSNQAAAQIQSLKLPQPPCETLRG